eukprot:PhF_6_TR902/c0_g1_i2/m.1453
MTQRNSHLPQNAFYSVLKCHNKIVKQTPQQLRKLLLVMVVLMKALKTQKHCNGCRHCVMWNADNNNNNTRQQKRKIQPPRNWNQYYSNLSEALCLQYERRFQRSYV